MARIQLWSDDDYRGMEHQIQKGAHHLFNKKPEKAHPSKRRRKRKGKKEVKGKKKKKKKWAFLLLD